MVREGVKIILNLICYVLEIRSFPPIPLLAGGFQLVLIFPGHFFGGILFPFLFPPSVPGPAHSRVCLKIHSRHLHAPLCGIFGPNSLNVAHYAAFIWAKPPTKWNAQLPESNFQTRSSISLHSSLTTFCVPRNPESPVPPRARTPDCGSSQSGEPAHEPQGNQGSLPASELTSS